MRNLLFPLAFGSPRATDLPTSQFLPATVSLACEATQSNDVSLVIPTAGAAGTRIKNNAFNSNVIIFTGPDAADMFLDDGSSTFAFTQRLPDSRIGPKFISTCRL